MNEQLRKDVWEAMLDTDRLERYYGRRAAKLARRETAVTGATCAFAVVSAILLTVVGSTQWAAVAIVITALVSIVPLLSRLGERVLSAAYCQKRLGDLSIEWSALWQEVEELPTNELRSRWQSLSQRLNEATAHKATEAIDNKLLGLTETESDEYWTDEAASPTRSPDSVTHLGSFTDPYSGTLQVSPEGFQPVFFVPVKISAITVSLNRALIQNGESTQNHDQSM